MIELKHISKTFGDHTVLRDVSLAIAKGEVVTLIGPSGSGKSTLLRCINLLETPTQGKLSISGLTFDAARPDAEMTKAIRRHCGMVFQNFNLFPHLTALNNITYAPIHTLNQSPELAYEKAMTLLSRVGLAEKAAQYPAQLSGGQKQRVAIARALAMEPDIMLFDEPTSALDPEMVKEVLDVMRELANAQMTMIVVTHEMRFAQAVATRLLFLDQGQIIEDTKPQAFFEKPATPRAREFLSRLV